MIFQSLHLTAEAKSFTVTALTTYDWEVQNKWQNGEGNIILCAQM